MPVRLSQEHTINNYYYHRSLNRSTEDKLHFKLSQYKTPFDDKTLELPVLKHFRIITTNDDIDVSSVLTLLNSWNDVHRVKVLPQGLSHTSSSSRLERVAIPSVIAACWVGWNSGPYRPFFTICRQQFTISNTRARVITVYNNFPCLMTPYCILEIFVINLQNRRNYVFGQHFFWGGKGPH